jgi:hypothetical protein
VRLFQKYISKVNNKPHGVTFQNSEIINFKESLNLNIVQLNVMGGQNASGKLERGS